MSSFDHQALFLSKFYEYYFLVVAIIVSVRPEEKDLVAVYHEKKWFRGRCLKSLNENVNVLCIDSGVIISCRRNGNKI